MTLPLLIVDGTREQRKDKAWEIARRSSSDFDIGVVDTQETAGIDLIRELNRRLTQRPFNSAKQSAVLLEAQNLTVEAQNAFLKNLEEASPSAQIILTAATSEGLLSTVVSRCAKIELPTQNEEISAADQRFLENFVQSGLYAQYQNLDKLDLTVWLVLWRKILLAALGVEKNFFYSNAGPATILRYLRLINKLRSLQKRRAAPKLLKSILIMETPKIEMGK